MDQLAKIVMDDKKYADFCVKYCGYDLHIENEEVHPIYHLQVGFICVITRIECRKMAQKNRFFNSAAIGKKAQ